jgi:hypothetical protein
MTRATPANDPHCGKLPRTVLILPISRSWILSRRAQRVYFGCAILSLALSGTWIGTRAAQIFAGNYGLTPGTANLVGCSLLAETIGAALLWVAMLYFWFGFDQSSWLKRAIWFCFLALLLPFFWALYYFFVYRKQLSSQVPRPSATVDIHD